jgi:hypothetical protein
MAPQRSWSRHRDKAEPAQPDWERGSDLYQVQGRQQRRRASMERIVVTGPGGWVTHRTGDRAAALGVRRHSGPAQFLICSDAFALRGGMNSEAQLNLSPHW